MGSSDDKVGHPVRTVQKLRARRGKVAPSKVHRRARVITAAGKIVERTLGRIGREDRSRSSLSQRRADIGQRVVRQQNPHQGPRFPAQRRVVSAFVLRIDERSSGLCGA